MKTSTVLTSLVVLSFSGIWACQTDIRPPQTVCTEEFQSIGIRVLGDSLTDFYTIRLVTSDTIRRSTGFESQTHWYPVLDDSYRRQLASKQESFQFIGKQGQRIVIRQDYIIEADQCHIRKVSGRNEIQL